VDHLRVIAISMLTCVVTIMDTVIIGPAITTNMRPMDGIVTQPDPSFGNAAVA